MWFLLVKAVGLSNTWQFLNSHCLLRKSQKRRKRGSTWWIRKKLRQRRRYQSINQSINLFQEQTHKNWNRRKDSGNIQRLLKYNEQIKTYYKSTYTTMYNQSINQSRLKKKRYLPLMLILVLVLVLVFASLVLVLVLVLVGLVLVLVLVLKDSLRTKFKSLSLSLQV